MTLTFFQELEAGDYLLVLKDEEVRSLRDYLDRQLLARNPNETITLSLQFYNIHTPSGQVTIIAGGKK